MFFNVFHTCVALQLAHIAAVWPQGTKPCNDDLQCTWFVELCQNGKCEANGKCKSKYSWHVKQAVKNLAVNHRNFQPVLQHSIALHQWNAAGCTALTVCILTCSEEKTSK